MRLLLASLMLGMGAILPLERAEISSAPMALAQPESQELDISAVVVMVDQKKTVCHDCNPLTLGNKIYLNQADAKMLEALPRIGKKRAQQIVEYREKHGDFASIDELEKIKGIGKKTVALLRDYLLLQ